MAENNCKCAICGKEFHVPPSTIRKGFGKYCSAECRNEGTRGKAKKRMPILTRDEWSNAFYDVISGEKAMWVAAKDLGISAPTLKKWLYKFVYEGVIPPDKYFADPRVENEKASE